VKRFLSLILISSFIFTSGCLDTDGEIDGTASNGSNEQIELRPEDVLAGVLNPGVLIGEVAQMPGPLNGSTCNASEILEWNGVEWICVPTPSVLGGAATTVPASGVQPGTIQAGVLISATQLTGSINPATQIGAGAINGSATLASTQITSACASNQILQANGAGNFVCANLPAPPVAPVTSVYGRTGVVAASAGDYSANLVTNVAAGNIAALNVQAALNELDGEKLALTGGAMSGAIAMGTNKISGLGVPTLAADAATKAYVDTAVGGVAGDNLGNHTATTNIQLGTNFLSGDGDAEGVFVDGLGNVGIGTVAPSSNLEVEGSTASITVDSTSGNSSLRINSLPGSRSSLGLQKNNLTRWILESDGIAESGADVGSNFAIKRYSDAGTLTETSFWIARDTGSVGIGTTTPAERLDVVGNIRGTQLCIGADCRSAWPGAGGGGTVTSVATGTGLTGGPITGSGTLSIANLGVGTGQLALNAVTTAQILDGTILNEDIVDNTIIATAKLTSACTNNQILQSNGAGNFVCANAPMAPVTSVYGRTGVVVALDDDYTASQINNTAAGAIAATDVQAAINELDTEKLALAGGTMTGAINMSSNLISNLATPVAGTDATTKAYVDTAVAGAAGAPGGATTQVQFNDAGAFAGDSNFVWDNTNKSLGVGVAPATDVSLDVVGNQRISERLAIGSTPITAGNTLLQVEDGRVNFSSSTSSSGLTIRRDVGGNNISPFIRMDRMRSGALAPGTGFGGSTDYYLEGNTPDTAALAAQTTVGWVGAQVDDSLSRDSYYSISTMSANVLSEQVRIVENGNVGIGTSSPAEMLDVAGNIRGAQLCIGADCRSAWPGAGGGGTVTSVATGTGLTGGPITGSGTLSIANLGVGTGQLALNAVTTAQILDGTILNEDIVDNTIIATDKLTSACTNNQILQSNGAGNFVCANAPTAPVTSVYGRTGVVVALDDDYTSSQINNTAAGSIAATDVQAAINELDTEKLALAGGTMSGAINMSSNLISNLATPVAGSDGATKAYVDTAVGGAAGAPGGATTQVQFNNAGAFAGESAFVWDTVGKRLGIGTSSPDRALHVRTTGTYQVKLENADAGGGEWHIGQSDNVFGAGGGKLLFVPDSIVSTDAAVTFTNSGDVGIGTTAPGGKLHIADSDVSTTMYIENTSSTAARVPAVSINNYDGTGEGGYPYFQLFNSRGSSASPTATQSGDILGVIGFAGYGSAPSGGVSIQAFAAENWTVASNAGDLAFGTTPSGATSAIERLRVDSTGNVGIGTTTPGERLDVAGNIRGTQLCIGADCRSAWPGAGGGGTVTSVATGTGLTGGPITGSGTLSIANLGVGTGQLALNAVTTAQILDGTILNDDIVDNTIVATAKLTSACTNNQILQSNGAGNFVCANLPTPVAAPVDSVFGRTGAVVATAGDYSANLITNVVAGNIAATDVQAAINELDIEKLALAGGTMTGAIAMGTNKITGLGTPTLAADAATKAYVDSSVAAAGGGDFMADGSIAMTGLLEADNGVDVPRGQSINFDGISKRIAGFTNELDFRAGSGRMKLWSNGSLVVGTDTCL
jgi:hypothetical protein